MRSTNALSGAVLAERKVRSVSVIVPNASSRFGLPQALAWRTILSRRGPKTGGLSRPIPAGAPPDRTQRCGVAENGAL